MNHATRYGQERGSKWVYLGACFSLRKVKLLVAQSCPTPCDLMDYSPPGSSVTGFSRQEYWSGLTLPSPGDFPHPGIKPGAPARQADCSPSKPPGKPPGGPPPSPSALGTRNGPCSAGQGQDARGHRRSLLPAEATGAPCQSPVGRSCL